MVCLLRRCCTTTFGQRSPHLTRRCFARRAIFNRAHERLGRRLQLGDLRPCSFNLFHGQNSWYDLMLRLGDVPSDDEWRRVMLRDAVQLDMFDDQQLEQERHWQRVRGDLTR
jgi:hypothetical protein